MTQYLELEPRKYRVLLYSIAVFIACLVISSITAQKLYFWTLFDLSVAIPVGTSLFALTFLATDSISEIFGRRQALNLVFAGLVCRVIVVLFLLFAVSREPVPFFEFESEYDIILGFDGAGRVVVAGIVAYVISQVSDILIFHHLREKGGKGSRLYVRNLASTTTSQFLDTVVFVVIAFGGVVPLSDIPLIILGQLVVKWLIALLDTPFVYMIRNYAFGRPILDFKD